MIIVGGTYFERCAFPEWDTLLGSGLRAAIQLSNFYPIELHTYASPYTQRRLALLAGIYENVDIRAYPSPFTFTFDYVHTLTTPVVDTQYDDTIKTLPQIRIKGERILVYGCMEEEQPQVDGDWVVYDPQSSTRRFTEFGTARHLAVVMNAAEARIWGGDVEMDSRARNAAIAHGAEVIIVKNGPYGAIVYRLGEPPLYIPAYKTDRFFKIGSGDIFSAIFAHLWCAHELPLERCATLASHATAYYVSTKQYPQNLQDLPQYEEAPAQGTPSKVYLAGPFFTVGERWTINDIRGIFQALDVEVFSPIHDVGVGIDTDIAKADLAKLDESDLVFAVAAGADPGTLFEVGYAVKARKKIVVFHQNNRDSDLTMLRGSDCAVHSDLGAAIYNAIWRCGI